MNVICEESSSTKEESFENKVEYSATKKLVPLVDNCPAVELRHGRICNVW